MFSMTKNTKNLIDIVDKHNQLTGETCTPDESTDHGIWHRGAHVILYTKNAEILVQKRSKTIMQAPSKLTLGAGGFVDAGETPAQAAIRETFEETGVAIKENDLEFLSVVRQSKRWRYHGKKKLSNAFVYSYAAEISSNQIFTPQLSEAQWVKLLPMKDIKKLLTLRQLRNLGKVAPLVEFYADAIKKIELILKR